MRKNYCKFILALFVLFVGIDCYSQLSNFTLAVTSTNETCSGNGRLNFQTSGTNPEATVTFSIFRLPNIITPINILSTNSLTGLSSGNYRIVAKQTLGTLSNNQQQDAIIQNLQSPLEYNIAADPISCNGRITINVTSGNPISYEIFSGPVTRPQQASSEFTNLPSGNYVIRVHDACGDAVSKSFTLVRPIYSPTGITILSTEFPEMELPSCNQIVIGHHLQIAPQYYISYPLTFKYSVYPPGGGIPTIVTTAQNGSSGLNLGGIIPQIGTFRSTIPYYSSPYTYDLLVTDACGNTYARNNNIVNKKLKAEISFNIVRCGNRILKVSADFYKFPITVEFLSAPPGFNPSSFNGSHPTFAEFPFYGSDANPVPEGTYTVRVTDGCGQTGTDTIIIENEISATASGENNCGIGGSIIASVSGSSIISATITAAPPGFGFPLPHNVQAYINSEGVLKIIGIIIPGNYTITFADECTNTYIKNVSVPLPGTGGSATVSYLGSCDPGEGSVYIRVASGNILSVILTSGPSTYSQGFPHDISYNIRGNYLSMSSLPIGTYQAMVTDGCGSRLVPLNIVEYISNSTVNITERCSTFDLYLSHTNNNSLSNLGYWLQKQNPVTGVWGHPNTNIAYPLNTVPTSLNAISVNNNSLNLNLNSGGHFRVLTVSSLFGSNGVSNYCFRTINEFDTGNLPVIRNVTSFSCNANLSDVFIEVAGTGPFNFKILEKNYQPFAFNNNSNPLFSNLQTGVYLFQVEDLCGNRTTVTYDVAIPFVMRIEPTLCNGTNSSLSVSDFPYLEYKWYKQGQQNIVLSTTATLNFTPLNFITHSGTYNVQIIYPSNLNSCLNRTLSYEINAGASPNAGIGNSISLCTIPATINLFDYLLGNYDQSGTWEQITTGGTLSSNVWNPTGVASGIYRFKYSVAGFCGVNDEAIVTIEFASALLPPTVNTLSPVCIGETVNIEVTNPNLLYTYSWTGPNGFLSNVYNPVFPVASEIMAGDYTVTAYLGTCPSQSVTTTLVIKPQPNFHFANESLAICEGQESTISIIGDNFDINLATYKWFFQGLETSATSSEIEIEEPGIYKVMVTYNGCSTEKETQVELNTNVFSLGTKVECDNDLYVLSVFSIENSFDESNATYIWSGPNGFSSTTRIVDVTGLDSGDYKIIVTNEDGCKSEASIHVQKAYCNIPKGVSPNDDGNNDTWYLVGLDIEKVKIFNRYGTEVYEQNNYQQEWFGQEKNGNLLPSATYFYHIKFKSGQEKTGWVYLNREK